MTTVDCVTTVEAVATCTGCTASGMTVHCEGLTVCDPMPGTSGLNLARSGMALGTELRRRMGNARGGTRRYLASLTISTPTTEPLDQIMLAAHGRDEQARDKWDGISHLHGKYLDRLGHDSSASSAWFHRLRWSDMIPSAARASRYLC